MPAQPSDDTDAPEPRTSALDPAVVDQLRALAKAGNAELLHLLQASFARDAPGRLLALRTAVAAGDADATAFNVHTLIGSAANLGAAEVVATCRLIEGSATSDAAELEPLLVELERRTAQAQTELTRLAETG